jgi:hypothetical protein
VIPLDLRGNHRLRGIHHSADSRFRIHLGTRRRGLGRDQLDVRFSTLRLEEQTGSKRPISAG